jgi:hypothetical protein
MLRGGAGGNKIRPTVVGMAREECESLTGESHVSIFSVFPAVRDQKNPHQRELTPRPISLHRLLTSLRTAHYFGDDVSLAINLEQTADSIRGV